MSEYQYHEWQTVDRVLMPEEQAAVEDLSSHIDVSASQAVVTYHWSDFRHDPRQVLLQYFDAYFYMANWGSLRLMFRFPKGLLDEADIEPYCVYEYITFETSGEYQVLDLDFQPEDGGGWIEAEAGLSHFVHLRADLLEGDYRLLYLAWLKAVTFYDLIYADEFGDGGPDSLDYDCEPPIPAGLKKLSPALQSFVQVFDLDPYLVQAAAENSPDFKSPLPVDYGNLVERLSRSECNEFLARLAEGYPGVKLALRKRLSAFVEQEQPQSAERRTLHQLLKRAQQIQEAEEKRLAEEAHKKNIAEIEALAKREAQAWRQVEQLIEMKQAKPYDQAVALLGKLREVAEFQGNQANFRERVEMLRKRYKSRYSLMERFDRAGF